MEVKNSPLKKVWSIISIPIGVLGLLGLSDSLVAWHENIKTIIESYHYVVRPLFDFLLGWLPFSIPQALYDYFFIGILFRSAAIKTRADFDAMNIEIGAAEPEEDTDPIWAKVIADPITHLILVVSAAIIWPYMLFIYTKRAYDKRLKQQVSYVYRLTLHWFLAVFVVFIVVLIVNYTYLIRQW